MREDEQAILDELQYYFVFGSRSARLVARLLLRRLLESERVRATEETIRQAKELV